jgi:hypothetical protein
MWFVPRNYKRFNNNRGVRTVTVQREDRVTGIVRIMSRLIALSDLKETCVGRSGFYGFDLT